MPFEPLEQLEDYAVDWSDIAQRALRHIGAGMFEAHRGALPTPWQGVYALFSNRGSIEAGTVRRAIRELAKETSNSTRKHFGKLLGELAFATAPEEQEGDELTADWVLLVRVPLYNAGNFDALVWNAWRYAEKWQGSEDGPMEDFDHNAACQRDLQSAIAFDVLTRTALDALAPNGQPAQK